MNERDELIVRLVTIITLGVILLTAVIGLTIVSVMTDRNMARAEGLTFAGVVLLGALGGFSAAMLRRRHRWRVHVERENGATDEPNPDGR